MGSWTSPESDVAPTSPAACRLRILLVGLRRTGKSSVGNTLLGQGRVFDTRGGGASTATDGIAAGRQVTVVDGQGWGSSEDSVPQGEKVELLRALSLCEPGGPHLILLVIPLLDFTEPERRALERRMEILTPGVWRHTMVLFTFGDWLRARGRDVRQHIQSGGPALRWLMEKCRYRYHVVDNKMTAATHTETNGQQEGRKGEERKEGMSWQRKEESEGRRGEGRQVRELVSTVEDLLQENGGWHFSLHMYHRQEEEWNRREQELWARMERGERKERGEGGKGGLRMEVAGESAEIWENMSEGGERRYEEELGRQSSEEDWDRGSDSGGERDEAMEVKTDVMVPYRPNGPQCLAFSPFKRLA